MKILLLNDNPVVNKLVTLSAQKTSDELDVIDSIESLQSGEYDLLVVDDTMYNEDMFSEIKSKIMFSKSLYICSRDAAKVEAFSSTLKKPFLPTDLVELFLKFSKEVNTSSLSQEEKTTDLDELEEFITEELVLDEKVTEQSDLEELEEFETEEDSEELLLDEDIDLSLDDELGELDDDFLLEDDELLLDDDDLSLDDELSFSDEDIEEGESVLDDEEAQKVKDLLDETSDEVSQKIPEYDPQFVANELGLPVEEIEEFIQDFINQAYEFKEELYASLVSVDLDNVKSLSHKIKGVAANLRIQEALDAISIVNTSADNAEIEDSLNNFYKIVDRLAGVDTSSSSEDEITTGLSELDELNTEEFNSEELELNEELEDELTFDEEEAESEIDKAVTEELALDEELSLEESEEELDLETQIENAVESLSDEDLESELDEETLLEIATNEIDSSDMFDSLTSNDLKLAIGEEIVEVNTGMPEISSDDANLESFEETHEEATISEETEVQANSIEALENLLATLKDKDIVASLKGQKININITIGDE